MVLIVRSLVISRLNHVMSFISGLTAAILILVGMASNIAKPEKLERMCSVKRFLEVNEIGKKTPNYHQYLIHSYWIRLLLSISKKLIWYNLRYV